MNEIDKFIQDICGELDLSNDEYITNAISKISTHLQLYGIVDNDVNDIGVMCERALDYLSEI